jgi:hypothetical protein
MRPIGRSGNRASSPTGLEKSWVGKMVSCSVFASRDRAAVVATQREALHVLDCFAPFGRSQ